MDKKLENRGGRRCDRFGDRTVSVPVAGGHVKFVQGFTHEYVPVLGRRPHAAPAIARCEEGAYGQYSTPVKNGLTAPASGCIGGRKSEIILARALN